MTNVVIYLHFRNDVMQNIGFQFMGGNLLNGTL